MRKSMYLIATVFLSTAVMHGAEANANAPDATAAFERLKTLTGEWEADTQAGKAYVSYELTAGGTALVERDTHAGMHEGMLTVYHLDGKRLLLTHYCMAGNQPRMQARSFNPETGQVAFQFLDITNLSNPGAAHMHNASFRIIDKDHLVSEWDLYENGQKKVTETFQYTRVR